MRAIDRILTSLAHSKRKVSDFFCGMQIKSEYFFQDMRLQSMDLAKRR